MKNLVSMLAGTMIVLALTSIQSLAQSAYEPYTFTTLAGNTGYGSDDGTGSAARFFEPASVAVDSAGNVYVADNNTIRKGSPAPMGFLLFGPRTGFNGGPFGFFLTGSAGRAVVVEASTDLKNWLPVWTNTFAGALNFVDRQNGTYSNRFYRAFMP